MKNNPKGQIIVKPLSAIQIIHKNDLKTTLKRYILKRF